MLTIFQDSVMMFFFSNHSETNLFNSSVYLQFIALISKYLYWSINSTHSTWVRINLDKPTTVDHFTCHLVDSAPEWLTSTVFPNDCFLPHLSVLIYSLTLTFKFSPRRENTHNNKCSLSTIEQHSKEKHTKQTRLKSWIKTYRLSQMSQQQLIKQLISIKSLTVK